MDYHEEKLIAHVIMWLRSLILLNNPSIGLLDSIMLTSRSRISALKDRGNVSIKRNNTWFRFALFQHLKCIIENPPQLNWSNKESLYAVVFNQAALLLSLTKYEAECHTLQLCVCHTALHFCLPSFQKWPFVANLWGHWREMGDTTALCESSNELWGLFDNRKVPVYIIKIRKSPPAHPWAPSA